MARSDLPIEQPTRVELLINLRTAGTLATLRRAPATFDDITKGGGWSPNGHGVLTEKITLSDDGKSYTSTIVFSAFDQAGKPVGGGGEGTGAGKRIDF